jgi:hypothetical protein
MRRKLLIRATVLFAFAAIEVAFSAAQIKPEEKAARDAKNPAFAAFEQNVKRYEDLRSQVDRQVPALKPSADPQQVLVQQQALAAKLAEARKGAKRGDIFTDEVSAEFRKRIQAAFNGPKGGEVHKTLRQGEPLDLQVHVNEVYPASLPATTVPPTLLEELPKLPPDLEYRIAGDDFVLQDVKARLVIDFIPGAVPEPGR